MRILKYSLAGMQTTVDMFAGAKILCLQYQNGIPCLWVEADSSGLWQSRQFRAYGTGWDLPDDPGSYIGTLQDAEGNVWHFYEVTR